MKPVQITGLVIANAWGPEGEVIGAALATPEEKIISIKRDSSINQALITRLHQVVLVEGWLETILLEGRVLETPPVGGAGRIDGSITSGAIG